MAEGTAVSLALTKLPRLNSPYVCNQSFGSAPVAPVSGSDAGKRTWRMRSSTSGVGAVRQMSQ